MMLLLIEPELLLIALLLLLLLLPILLLLLLLLLLLMPVLLSRIAAATEVVLAALLRVGECLICCCNLRKFFLCSDIVIQCDYRQLAVCGGAGLPAATEKISASIGRHARRPADGDAPACGLLFLSGCLQIANQAGVRGA